MEKHVSLSRRYVRHADDLLQKKDRTQASEKYWGAVATLLKAVGHKHRWPCHTHRHNAEIIQKLFERSGDRDLLRLFAVAEQLHANFYEDFLKQRELRLQAEDVKTLVSKLHSHLNGNGKSRLSPPIGSASPSLARRRGRDWPSMRL